MPDALATKGGVAPSRTRVLPLIEDTPPTTPATEELNDTSLHGLIPLPFGKRLLPRLFGYKEAPEAKGWPWVQASNTCAPHIAHTPLR